MPWCMSNQKVDALADGKARATPNEVQALAAEVKRSRTYIQSLERMTHPPLREDATCTE